MPVLGFATRVGISCGFDNLLSCEDFAQVIQEKRLDALFDALLAVWSPGFLVEFS